MKNTFGRNITVTLFGESHGPAVGAVIDGIPAGVKIDYELMERMMNQRKASGSISTARHEKDLPEILSGVKGGYSEGTPLTLIVRNDNVRRSDYADIHLIPRPGHADYTGHVKYRGYEDTSGGGHFSARLTAPLVAAGAICMHMLEEKGIRIGTHIRFLHGISDRAFDENHLEEDIAYLSQVQFPVLEKENEGKMISEIEQAAKEQDSVGGILETAISSLEAGIGDPFFDSLESQLAHAVFSVPAVKGIEFGSGFDFATMKGSEANDAFSAADGKVVTLTNHNGGINGGISNGMPIIFRTVLKPTPSIAKSQNSVDLATMNNTTIEIKGRHDPAVIHRARAVIDAVTAITVCDALISRHGELFFGGGK